MANNIITALQAYSGLPDNGRIARTTLQQIEIYFNDTIRPTLTEANDLLEHLPDTDMAGLTAEQKDAVLTVADEVQRVHNAASDISESTRNRLRNLVSCHDFLDQV